jgi:hypothetical protein
MVTDDRLVVKEMVNAWNIAEKDAFLRFAPKYFDYVKESDKVRFEKVENVESNTLFDLLGAVPSCQNLWVL